MKVYINENMFQSMMKAVKGAVAKIDMRPELTYIKINVSGDIVTAYACDGCVGAKMSFKAKESDGEDFDCYIKPFTFKASKGGQNEVTIELIDKTAIVEIPEAFGTLVYKFEQPKIKSLDFEKLFSTMKNHDREVGVNSALMARCLYAIATISTNHHNLAIIASKENPREGFCIRTLEDGFTFEQFLMPVRYEE